MNTDTRSMPRGELLKYLRETYPQGVARAQALLKEQKNMHDAFCTLFREKPCTIPEVAQATGIPAEKVLWFVAAMKKYGLVEETGMCGDYPLYKKAEEK